MWCDTFDETPSSTCEMRISDTLVLLVVDSFDKASLDDSLHSTCEATSRQPKFVRKITHSKSMIWRL
jgi:hypothetical protein